MKFTNENGKVWEWRGEYRYPKQGEFYLNPATERWPEEAIIGVASLDYSRNILAILHPVHPIHEFGGVKFAETGEVDFVLPGQWYHQYNTPVYWPSSKQIPTIAKQIILRPLQGE